MIFSNFFDTKGKMFTVLYFASLLWFYFSKTGIMSESFNVSRSFFMNWAKNWKVPIWFRKKKSKDFWDFWVFKFSLYRRSKTQKSRKFRLPQIMILSAYQDLKTPKKSIYTKAKKVAIWFRTKRKIFEISKFSILLCTQNRKLGNLGKFSFNWNFHSLKSKRMRYGSRKKKLKFPRFPSFWFCSITKIENSEI